MSVEVSEEEKLFALIGWAASIVGAIIVLVLKPQFKYAKYWSYLSISLFILAAIAGISIAIITAILGLIPIVGGIISLVLSSLLGIAIVIAWIIGILKSLSKEYWKPPIIYDVAKMIGIEKI
ncbi:MAG: hypothetical protein RMI83_03990 [Desulfurococcaceae archaeon]|nr:hypothetical protein [Sulfolobales archaeon]MDW8170248.1 hypothetical protein [Desulfurococcaceae archaeon]